MSFDPIRRRPARLVLDLLGHVYDADEPIPWLELIDTFADGHPWKTVENVVHELVAYGALHRIGRPGDRRRPDTRALKPTALGQAWLDGEVLPRPGEPDPGDALEQADAIAVELGAELLEEDDHADM